MRIKRIVEIQTEMSTSFKMAKPLNVMIGIKSEHALVEKSDSANVNIRLGLGRISL